jgi:hypothetical protein
MQKGRFGVRKFSLGAFPSPNAPSIIPRTVSDGPQVTLGILPKPLGMPSKSLGMPPKPLEMLPKLLGMLPKALEMPPKLLGVRSKPLEVCSKLLGKPSKWVAICPKGIWVDLGRLVGDNPSTGARISVAVLVLISCFGIRGKG